MHALRTVSLCVELSHGEPRSTLDCDCDGLGLLADPVFDHAVIPDGWTLIQRCDRCERYPNDEAAAQIAAALLRVEYRYFPTPPSEQPHSMYPGDWAIGTSAAS